MRALRRTLPAAARGAPRRAAGAALRRGRAAVPSPPRAAAIRRRLLRWYRSSRRALPWRERPDPYRVWVAEVMLQQTQVAAVVPYYERFLRRFPDLPSLAAADEEEVAALWSGLGYYSRARNLHRAARRVMERHAGRIPSERGALEALPGIGCYTAGAILSIAFGLEEPVVDGNVRRLLSRLFAGTAPPSISPLRGRSELAVLEAQARALVRGAPPSDLNQALMELGALVCRPASPRCPECPLEPVCEARRLGVEERVPEPRRRAAVRSVRRAVALIRSGRRILLERGEGPGAPRGMWDLPGALVPEGREPRKFLERSLRGRRIAARVGAPVAEVDHSITFRRIRTTAYEARLSEPPPDAPSRLWVEAERIAALPVGAAARRLLERVPYFFSG